MRIMPATLPPVIVRPYSLRVCVDGRREMLVPSRGWRDRACGICSVASVVSVSIFLCDVLATQSSWTKIAETEK